jgi:4-hydroxybenzoate polyprenyltransferase
VSTEEAPIGELRARSGRVRALMRSCHPGPCLVITAMIVLVAVAADLRGARLAVFTLGGLTGQLSIGWSNDAFDADRDAAAGRQDKPIVAGDIGHRTVSAAAVVALVACVLLCFWVGPLTGLLNLIIVAAGWAYNAGLKSTLASGPMYVIGFGAIPAFAASTNRDHPVAQPWTFAAAALLGLGAHFANVLPDLATDRATGVRGLPQRVAEAYGQRAVRWTALTLLLTASCVIVIVPGGPRNWLAVVGLSAAVLLVLVGARASGRLPFVAALGVAAIDVALYALREVGLGS